MEDRRRKAEDGRRKAEVKSLKTVSFQKVAVTETQNSALLIYWTLANSCITGVVLGRPSSVVTRVLTEKCQSPIIY